ncbi:MAG: hypothetical protein WCR71_04130 [Bacteroidales bacterium]
MKWFKGAGRGVLNDQKEAFRRPRKTTKKIASQKNLAMIARNYL